MVENLNSLSVKGAPGAPVTIVEFSDLECPFCRRAAATMREVVAAYPGKIRLIFKHAPLDFHTHARTAHQALLAAGAQGKFWEMHDLVFASTKGIERGELTRFARQLGLDEKVFKDALDSQAFDSIIERDLAEARALGVDGRPAFFINGRKLEGAKSFQVFKAVIDEALNEGQGATPAQANTPSNPALPRLEASQIATTNAPTRGSPQAPVSVIVFTDFQCPFCARQAATLDQVVKGYGDKVHLIFKNFPLDFHTKAPLAHQAALAAKAQGKFWEMHDLIFKHQAAIDRDALIAHARQLQLDIPRFTRELDEGKYRSAVEADKQEGLRLGISGTPVVIVNGRQFDGAQSIEKLRQIIDAEMPNSWREPAMPSSSVKGSEVAEADEDDVRLTKGARTAPIRIVWFSDLQSSLTPKAAALVAEVMTAYPGKIQLQFKHRPLETRPHAVGVHEAALAAGAQDKFWEMHDLILAHKGAVTRGDLTKYAAQLGLSIPEFTAALDKGTYRAQVERDLREARRREVRGSPVFFINNTRIDGLQPALMFREIIDRELLKSVEARR